MQNAIRAGLERDRTRLLLRLQVANLNQHKAGDISIGSTHQQPAYFQDAIDRIDHNLRVIDHADRT